MLGLLGAIFFLMALFGLVFDGCSGRVFVYDCICGVEIFLVYYMILILIMTSLSFPLRFNTLVFSYNGGCFPTFQIGLLHATSEFLCIVLVLLDMNLD